MTSLSMIGKEKELFQFMKENGYPIYHLSNIFKRDIEYGIRDYYRTHIKKDVGTLSSRSLAKELIEYLLTQNIFSPLATNTWILNMPEFLNQPIKAEPQKEAA